MKLLENGLDELRVADRKGRITLGSKYAGKRFALHEEADGSTVLTPVLVVPDNEQSLTSRRLTEIFEPLRGLIDNWDGRNSIAPSTELIDHAREALALLHAGTIARNTRWVDPHVGSNELGQVTLEWWNHSRSLTLFVRSSDRVEYLKAWGQDIESQMEDGEVIRLNDFVTLSHWLFQADASAE